MKFAVQVNAHPDTSRAADHAYQFTKAAIAKRHEVIRVFFYFDGVLTGAMPVTAYPERRFDTAAWSQLARDHQLDLVLCVSAAERRGLGCGETFREVAPGFRLGGLGQWVDACLCAERVVVFAR
jgi:tRNA 2-thiouridine synthesizing protein D